MFLSVIVPAYNSERTLERCLGAIWDSDHKHYELLVVNDASRDATASIAGKYADRVVSHAKNLGPDAARYSGIRAARGEVFVHIDSDVVVCPGTLSKIDAYFSSHPDVDALTGRLSKEHPHRDFFSQYKNLYMHYIFGKLPERVSFLYGSIYAVRKEATELFVLDHRTEEDTERGQRLAMAGKKIAFLRGLEVVHLKKYDFVSWVKNDFRVPFNWAGIFLKYQGWKRLGKNQTGFAHAPKNQLVSVVLAPGILLLGIASLYLGSAPTLSAALAAVWLWLNLDFHRFLAREKGPIFGLAALFVTFLDHLVMASGILLGIMAFNIRVGRSGR